MSKLFRYGGVAASIVLIAFGIGAVVIGVNGRDQVRSDLAREQIVGTPDSTIPGQKVDTGSEAQAFAKVMRKHTLEATGGQTYAQMGQFLDKAGKPTSDEKAAAIDPKTQQAGRQPGAPDLGHRDRAHDRPEHRLLRRERRHLRDRHGHRPDARRRRVPRVPAHRPAPPRARPGEPHVAPTGGAQRRLSPLLLSRRPARSLPTRAAQEPRPAASGRGSCSSDSSPTTVPERLRMITADYPRELETDVVLRDGSTIRVRPVRTSDRDGLLGVPRRRSRPSRAGSGSSPAAANLEQAAAWAADVDYADRLGLVATVGEDERIVAHAVSIRDGRRTRRGRVRRRRRAAGPRRRDDPARPPRRPRRAREASTPSRRIVLPENHRMLQVFRDSGFPLSVHSEPGRLSIELPTSLTPEARARFEDRDRVAAAAAVARVLEPTSVALDRRVATAPARSARRSRATSSPAGSRGDVCTSSTAAAARWAARVHRSVLDVPGPVDLAVIAVPPRPCSGSRASARAKGVRALVVISAGFAEVGRGGRAAPARAARGVPRRPACASSAPTASGVAEHRSGGRLNATFAPPRRRPARVGVHVAERRRSGSPCIERAARARPRPLVVRLGRQQGRPLAATTSSGTGRTTRPPTSILLYLESFGNPRRFARDRAARRRAEADRRGQERAARPRARGPRARTPARCSPRPT